jgi:MFS family permease
MGGRVRAAWVLFFLTGLVSASWAARVPAIQEQLGLSPGLLGLAVLGLEAGAIGGLSAGGALVGRHGARTILRAGFLAYPLALVGVAIAPSLGALAAALAAMAFANSLVDVALNVEGVALERRTGRPCMARLHAGHAFGVLAGGAAGTAAAAAGLAVAPHFALIAALALVAGERAAAALLGAPARTAARPPQRDAGGRGARRLDRRLALLGAVAFCAFLLDGSAYAWIAVQLRAGGAEPGLAAAGFTAFALALALGRLGADRLTARYGRIRVLQAGGALAAAGLAVALLVPALALPGWAAFGAGLAPIAPVVLAAAPAVSDRPAPAAIAAVTTIGYLGSFTGPPLIGALAGPLGLTAALAVMGAAAVAAALLARPALSPRGGRRTCSPRGRSASAGLPPA